MWNALNGEFNIWSLGIGFPICARRKANHPDVVSQSTCLVDPVDENIQEKWFKWKLSLKKIQEIQLSLC